MIWLLLGLWRSWLGGGIGKDVGPTWLRYFTVGLLAIVADAFNWKLALVDWFGILMLARVYGHGPMLQYPLHGDPDKDVILEFVGGAGGGLARWWEYALIRYMLPAAIWAAMRFTIHAHWLPVLVGTMFIVTTYFVCTKYLVGKLPTFNDPGSEADNWSELVGWTLLGVMLGQAH